MVGSLTQLPFEWVVEPKWLETAKVLDSYFELLNRFPSRRPHNLRPFAHIILTQLIVVDAFSLYAGLLKNKGG